MTYTELKSRMNKLDVSIGHYEYDIQDALDTIEELTPKLEALSQEYKELEDMLCQTEPE